MPAIGGPILALSIGGRDFAVASDSDVSRKMGGIEADVQMNGNSTGRIIQSLVGWSISGANVEIDDSRQDEEYLKEIAESTDWTDISITMASGYVYQGSGTVTGEAPVSSANATASINLMGEGQLTQQS